MARLGAVDQPLVVAPGEKEPAALRVLELLEHRVGHVFGKVEPLDREVGLQVFDQRIDEERVVVEIRIQVRAAVLVGGKQPSVLPHRVVDESQRPPRRVDPFAFFQYAAGAGHAAHHERIPGHQHLFVAAGPDALFPGSEHPGARRSDQRICGFALGQPRFAREYEVPVLVFEIRLAIEPVARGEGFIFLSSQERAHFLTLPDVELAFDAFGIGIEAGVVAAVGRLHLAHDPAGGFRSDTRVERLSGG